MVATVPEMVTVCVGSCLTSWAHPGSESAKANPDTVRAFSRALLAAIADIRDTPAKDQLPLLRKRFTGVEDDMQRGHRLTAEAFRRALLDE